ncbi:unnamed protein product [Brassica oleracea]
MQLSELNKGLIFTGLFKFIDIFISFFFILEGYVKRLVTLFFFLGFLFFFCGEVGDVGSNQGA